MDRSVWLTSAVLSLWAQEWVDLSGYEHEWVDLSGYRQRYSHCGCKSCSIFLVRCMSGSICLVTVSGTVHEWVDLFGYAQEWVDLSGYGWRYPHCGCTEWVDLFGHVPPLGVHEWVDFLGYVPALGVHERVAWIFLGMYPHLVYMSGSVLFVAHRHCGCMSG